MSSKQGIAPTLFQSTRRPRPGTSYVVPRDAIHLRTNDATILGLADRLWDRAPQEARPTRPLPAPLEFVVEVTPAVRGAPPQRLEERWNVGTDEAELSLGDDGLHAHIDCARGRLVGRVSAGLMRDQPSLVARLLLETPAAAMLARRGYCVLHAGVVTGPRGGVVIRGCASAGKSTLVAAAYRSGLGVLGDESVLAARSDPDELLAAVRDITLLPDARHLLGLDDTTTTPVGGAEGKRRLDMFSSCAPAARRARRVATVILGARDDGPARLEPLSPETGLEEFRRGGIAQEEWSGTPEHIAEHWSRDDAYRLSGAADLAGAVTLLAGLVTRRVVARTA